MAAGPHADADRCAADTTPGIQAPVATAEVLPLLDGIKAALPPGYRIETAGAVEESAKGSASINKVMPLMLAVMLALLMAQMQSFSRMAMVVLTAPLGLIGVTAALLAHRRAVRLRRHARPSSPWPESSCATA